MAHPINVPKLGLTMEEGNVVEWLAADGDRVQKGQPLFSIETDKIVSEVEADTDGYLQRVAEVDTTLPVGGLVAYLHPSAEAALAAARPSAGPANAQPAPPARPAAAPVGASTASPPPAAAVSPSGPQGAPATPAGPASAFAANRAQAATPPSSSSASGRVAISPVARTLAASKGVDPRSLRGSGPDGAILKRDVEAVLRSASAPPAQPVATGSVAATRRPMPGLRKAIAQRMMQSLAATAQMTGFGTVDMTEASRWRKAMVAEEQRLGARITFTDFALKAAATVLAQMPEMNSYIDGNEIVTWSDVNIGLAVALDDGLIVPVIRNVNELPLVELSRTRKALIEKARAGRLARDDVEGATFTLSNFGSYGGDFETPILNPPQSALLGIGQITDQPVVRDGEIVIRSMMAISLTFDHRLIDGAVGGRFRANFKALLEGSALWMATMR